MRWMDCVEDDLTRASVTKFTGNICKAKNGTVLYTAEDRERWRELVAASTAESSWTMKT